MLCYSSPQVVSVNPLFLRWLGSAQDQRKVVVLILRTSLIFSAGFDQLKNHMAGKPGDQTLLGEAQSGWVDKNQEFSLKLVNSWYLILIYGLRCWGRGGWIWSWEGEGQKGEEREGEVKKLTFDQDVILFSCFHSPQALPFWSHLQLYLTNTL